MTTTYELAAEPIWYIVNSSGGAAGGAKMYTRSSQNKTVDKPVYQDAGGTLAWTNPILFDLNGTQGPFYWQVNSADLSDSYYIFVNDSDGNLLWDIDEFLPTGGGGGGNITTFIPITNYIANNQFIDHIDDNAGPLPVNIVIAPSNHKGFTPALINPVIGTYGALGPDIRFVKNNTSATDALSFPLFSLGTSSLTGDVTPVDYVRYQCTGAGTGETYKSFQFPVTQKVNNLSSQEMTFNIWAKVTTTPVTLNVYLRQYFGTSPGATAESTTTRQLIGTIVLSTTWTQYSTGFTVPNISGESLGALGSQTDDDAVYLQLDMPLGSLCDVQFTKPKLYLGAIDPTLEFEDYDQINSVNSTARTGDIKTSLMSSAPNGWVAMNDGSIGNVGSGATNRANKDTFQLYKTIWDGVSDTYAPVSTGRGATAQADFLANKTLTLPRSLGRALAGAGAGAGLTSRALGQYVGAETISISAMPSHDHPGSTVGIRPQNGLLNAGGSTFMLQGGTTSLSIASQGSGAADGNMEPTSFFNVFIKL